MATKRRNLFLYLTIACFFGLIAIFIVDGYMGIYDILYVTTGEYEEKIDFRTSTRYLTFKSEKQKAAEAKPELVPEAKKRWKKWTPG